MMDSRGKYRKPERIGQLTDEIQVHYATETINTGGERLQTWYSLATVWAATDYNIQRSKENEKGGQETTQQVVIFTVRHRDDIREEMRVYFDSRLYDIEAISRSNDRQYMSLRCTQYQAGSYDAPTGGTLVGNAFYIESFTDTTGDTVTVTVYGGNVPDDKARVWVTLNGQDIAPALYEIEGSNIVLQGFELVATDTLTVRFFA